MLWNIIDLFLCTKTKSIPNVVNISVNISQISKLNIFRRYHKQILCRMMIKTRLFGLPLGEFPFNQDIKFQIKLIVVFFAEYGHRYRES